jgi:hypothetical protein
MWLTKVAAAESGIRGTIILVWFAHNCGLNCTLLWFAHNCCSSSLDAFSCHRALPGGRAKLLVVFPLAPSRARPMPSWVRQYQCNNHQHHPRRYMLINIYLYLSQTARYKSDLCSLLQHISSNTVPITLPRAESFAMHVSCAATTGMCDLIEHLLMSGSHHQPWRPLV